MYIHGHFYNEKDERIEVHIVTRDDRTKNIEIGTAGSGIDWTDDPMEIESQVNDTFDVLLEHQATIKLLMKNLTSDLFCASCRDAIVNIYRRGECLFAGFITPQTYSQPYNDVLDEIELNCVDVLSALQYSKYKNIGSLGVLYQQVKKRAKQCTFYDIMVEILKGATQGLDIVGGHTFRYLYDGSKALNNNSNKRYNIFKQLSISELLFLGQEDNVWQQDKILEEILRYLNLHIVQDGFTFYIFSWETVKDDKPIVWKDILNGMEVTDNRSTVTIRTGIVADTGTSISIGEVFNQILLACKTTEIDNVIESPLDGDTLIQLYDNRQKYITEFISDGEGHSAYDAFKAMCHGETTGYDAAVIKEWFLRVKGSKWWVFPKNGNTNTNLTDIYCAGRRNQHALPNWLGSNPGAAIVSFGHINRKISPNDNSPISKISMTDYLVISVNGNEKNEQDKVYPSETDIKANIPYAVYTGNQAGGMFSPIDDNAINYIVLSGSIILNPIMKMTDTYKKLHDTTDWSGDWNNKYLPKWWHKTVPSRTNGDGCYYTRMYLKAENAHDEPQWDRDTDGGLVPYTGTGEQLYEFSYSTIGDSNDHISKVPVLACMLIIGDKCLVETGKDGQTSDFKWQKYKALSQCANEDEYYQQSFTIGFDPKIGDKLIGNEFEMQNNINYTMGIDAEGIAIPIRKSDKVGGQVQFMILGPVNTLWNEITRVHPTFFRHTKWEINSVPLLAHVSSIMVKKFEVKIYSDNGMLDDTGKNDLIYMSDTEETFLNKKDGIEFNINSALTVDECRSLDVKNAVMLSTPINTETGDAVHDIYDYTQGIQEKPEHIYVDSYYKEYRYPRVIMEQRIEDDNENVGIFTHYIHPAMEKRFFVQSLNRNLMEGVAELKLKEINVK